MSIGDHVWPPPPPAAFPAPVETFLVPPCVGAAAAPFPAQALAAVRSLARFSSFVGGLGVEGALPPSLDAVAGEVFELELELELAFVG